MWILQLHHLLTVRRTAEWNRGFCTTPFVGGDTTLVLLCSLMISSVGVTVLFATWHDVLVGTEDIDFALVHPATEDSAVGVIAQIIVTQQAVQDQSSAIISVYDSDEDAERNPFTFAQVVASRLTLDDLIVVLQLQNDCPPAIMRNLCSLWFGRIPVSSFSTLRVHHGHAIPARS